MNRRGFLRGAISVMAVAAVLKGNVRTPDITDYHYPGGLRSGKTEMFTQPGFEVGDWISVSGVLAENNGVYKIETIKNGVMTFEN